MIATARRWLAARMARRFFLVFVFCAFLPLAAIAILSLVQVRALLAQQGEQRLAATAKAYGMTIFERLITAGDVALAASGSASPGEIALESRTFRSIAQVDWEGRVTALMGRADFLPVSGEDGDRLRTGKMVLRVTGGSARPRMELLAPRSPRTAGYVVGELQPEYVWGPSDELPTATDYCVVEDRWHTVIHCSAPMPLPALNGQTDWVRDGERFRSRLWTQFMRAAFGTPDWIIVAAQPESFQLARAVEFGRTYVPVVVLTLLLVLLLTVRQSRDISVPVERLAERVRGVSVHDFAGQTEVHREDELGQLADAFDQMSRQLGRQFSTLSALSEIDQLILATQDTAEVIQTVLVRLQDVTSADCVTVLLFDQEDTQHARTYFMEAHGGMGAISRHEMTSSDRNALSQTSSEWAKLDVPALPAFLHHVRDRAMASAYVQPVVWRGAACGAIVLGYATKRQPTEEERQSVRELGDRVAVAVSAAWRDRQLYQQSHFDPVTGAPNRLLFRDRLSLEIVRSQREGLRFALLFIDLDHFKHVNDSYGHSVGDAILREAAQRISRCLRTSDSVARLGGDEFTVLLPHVQQPQEAWLIAETIVTALSQEFVIAEQRCFLSASIGIATYPADGLTEEALLKSADTAMYRAKSAGRAQTVFFEERMNEEAVARMALDRDLRAAIERGELQLHYQPQLSMQTGFVVGAEALVRWTHPTRGAIPPTQFIALAEESGYIEALGQWIVQQACRQMRAWLDAGLKLPRISVNVSPRQFRRKGFVEFLERTVRESRVPPECLEIEVTEGLLMERGESAEALLKRLADGGHRIALDDFGTGFSSMSYLNRFPVHTLKIDRAFIVRLGETTDSEAIVAAIIAMAHALGKEVVAEGVELASQEAALRRLGCEAIQGFLYSPAVPPAQLAAFVVERLRAPVPLEL